MSFDKQVPIGIDSILTIVGWFAVYYFGFRQSKNKISLDKKISIYDKLTDLKQSLDDVFVFDLMTYTGHFKVFEITLTNPSRELLSYSQKLGDKAFNSHKAFQKFDSCVRAWIFLMPKLEKIEVIVAGEFYDFLDKAHTLKDAISDYALTLDGDEKNRKRKAIEKIFEEIEKTSSNMINFIDDFMELISDELTFPVFSHRMRRGIENLSEGQMYKKLTLNGIEEIPYKLKDFQKNPAVRP
jgi:hypothetical protein